MRVRSDVINALLPTVACGMKRWNVNQRNSDSWEQRVADVRMYAYRRYVWILGHIVGPAWTAIKHRSESSTRCCFWSGVSERGTHFENNLRIPKDSCKIVNTLPSVIFKVLVISHNFNLRSPKTILWTFVMFSGTWSVWSHLNSAYQYQQHFFPLKCDVWLAFETLFYPLFRKWQKLLHQNLCNLWTKHHIVTKFWHLTFEGWHYTEIRWVWQQWCHLYVRPEACWVMCYLCTFCLDLALGLLFFAYICRYYC